MQRACGIAVWRIVVWRIAVWRIAPLTMARRANDVRRALDANANGTRMRNRAIVHARMCMIYIRTRAWRRIADVSGAAAGMQIMRRICGCGWCYHA